MMNPISLRSALGRRPSRRRTCRAGLIAAVLFLGTSAAGCADDAAKSELDQPVTLSIDEGADQVDVFASTLGHGLIGVQRDQFGDPIPGGQPTVFLGRGEFGCDELPASSANVSAPLQMGLLVPGGGESFSQTFTISGTADGAAFSYGATGRIALSDVTPESATVVFDVDTLNATGDTQVGLSGTATVTRCPETR